MTELELANAALDCIQLNAGEFDKWLKIAMGYKAATGNDGAEYFNAWNLQQPSNRGAHDLKIYMQIKADGGITIATLIQIAKEYGFKMPEGSVTPRPRKKSIDNDVAEKTAPAIQFPAWDEYKDGDEIFKTTTPHPAPETRRKQRQEYIDNVFKNGDKIALAEIYCIGTAIYTFDDLKEWAQNADETNPHTSARISMKGLIATEEEKGGIFICVNPTNGKGRSDADIIDFRNTLIETDDASINVDDQINILKKSGIPFLTLTKTGGKSVHAIVYIGAGTDRELYDTRVNYLHKYLYERFGFLCDPADKNPARLTRMAGFLRWDKNGNRNGAQELIATGIADKKDLWESFYEQAEALKTTAPPKHLYELTSEEADHLKKTATLDEAGNPKQRLAEMAKIDETIKNAREKVKWIDGTRIAPETILSAMNYNENNPPIKTGLKSLDDLLNGGISGDFYILGGASGMGKTTLSLQIASALARAKYEVFYYSFEQDAASLTAKILAQIGAEIALKKYDRTGLYHTDHRAANTNIPNAQPKESIATRSGIAPPSREIFINGGKYFTSEEHKTFNSALKLLDSLKTLHLIEADHNYTAQKIADDITTAGEFFGYNKCVLFVDYLQKIPAAAGLTDKQATDITTDIFHEISRKHRIPIFAMSSLNRESYKGGDARAAAVSLASFKESGGIEYGVDVALGLQADGKDDGERKDRLAELHGTGSINLRVVLLKSRRGGKLGEHATLEFFPEYDFFLTADNEK